MNMQDRNLRQREIVPPDRLAACQATVVGVGAVGRQVALQLAALGVPWLQLIDFDVVEAVNLAPQGYMEADLGQLKVEATADLCRRLNSQLDVTVVAERFRRHIVIGNVLFCCVDSIATRKLIWESVRDRTSLFIDGRMAAEVLRVLTVYDESSARYYPTTLFSQEEAYVGSCTARSTIFTANIVAGLMLARFARWLRRLPAEPDLSVNLIADEMVVSMPADMLVSSQ